MRRSASVETRHGRVRGSNKGAPGLRRVVHRIVALLAAACVALLLTSALGCCHSDSSRREVVTLPTPSDVILITIDTLRADAIGSSGNRRVRTPILDRLAREGWTFRNAHGHNVVTLPSHVNIMTGLLPYQHGVRDNSGFKLDASIPTLASALKAQNYSTGAFVGAFPLDARFGLSRGFDVYDDAYPRANTSLDFQMPERPAAEVVAAARKWWEASRGRPRFLWVHLYDCHAPYRPPAPFAEEFQDDPYLGEVSAVDAALSPLLQPLLDGKSTGPMVIVTSDHGEARGDHGELTHGLFAYEATLHVPLLIWMRGSLSPRVVDDFVRHVDIAPTVLSAAGVPKPASLTGSSLLQARTSDSPPGSYFEAYSAAYNRGWAPLRGILQDGKKYIDLPVPELYDLVKDPEEKVNLADREDAILRRLARALPAKSTDARGSRGTVSSDDTKKLLSLGYLSGGSAIKSRYGPDEDPKTLIEVDRSLHDCVDLYQRHQLPAAITLARRISSEHPGMAVAYQNLAFLLRESGDARGSLEVYEAARQRGVLDEEMAWHFALALCEAGRSEEAIRLLTPFASHEDPDLLNALGIAYSDAGKRADALRVLERAASVDPRNVEAYENLGIVSLRADDASAARDQFSKAIAIDSGLPRAWNGMGVALSRLGERRRAIGCWSRAVALDPSLYDALFNLGSTAAEVGMRAEAREALTRFAATAPRNEYGRDIATAKQILARIGGGS